MAAYTRADELASAATRTQASALVATLNNAGTAAGTAVTGLLVDRVGVPPALLAAAAVVLVSAAVGTIATGRP